MPSGVSWSLHNEEKSFVQFLLDHKSEAGDGGTFKGSTYQKGVKHISHLCERGPPKDSKSLQNKWNAVSDSWLFPMLFYFLGLQKLTK